MTRKALGRIRNLLLLFLISIISAYSQIDESMELIPGGEFMMGKNSDKGLDFSPAHLVQISSFLIDKHEVTNAEYKMFCEKTGHKLPEFWNQDKFRSGDKYPDYPVIGITWNDARDYAAWVDKRLPTEAEWEYAARGSLVEQEFPNGDKWTKERKTNVPGEWENLIDPVAQFEANGYGLFDMGGNVWEWVSDRYSEEYYNISEANNPKGPVTGNNRVIRSGSWHSGSMCKKVYYRKGLPGSWVDFAVGFRCASNAPEIPDN